MFTAKIKITPKPGVLDPQGKTILHALETLGFSGLDDARIGKYIELRLNATNKELAASQVDAMCRKLLANMVIEAFEFEIV